MQRPESCGASAALELWPLAGREGADSGESCRLLLEEASRLPQLRGKAPRLVLSPAGSGQATAAALDMLRPLAAGLWPGLEPEALPAVPGPGDLARLAGGDRPVLLLQPRPEGPWEGMLLARKDDVAAPAPEAAVVSMPDMPAPPCEPGEGEIACDGVRFADLPHGGAIWHAGSVVPAWRQELLALGARPDAAALEAMGQRGIWLHPQGDVPPLAVMCCGQGAVWPGMGRELYDHFPAARAAMDRIARAADWDVLALLDETDVEKIGLTRWQQPYLFLLEYAQWSHLASLGLRPSLICGHSLGELIALCLAGVYEPEVAWYILDTRSTHMAELEARATRETGMMAVPAEASVIEEARKTWPQLYVSNYNSPRQFIISGPRDVLLEARKSLRKRRIPAIMLNVSLAFHHPSMRVLRDMSLRRLNALAMQAPQIPMLSCITTRPYPDDQPGICEHIGDLDENSVRWVECVQAMWQRDGIRHFVEVGPQDTLCGLVNDIEPQALCLAAGRKGKEAEGMRQTCARLYALGHLTHDGVARHRQRWLDAAPAPAASAEAPAAPAARAAAPARDELPEAARKVLEILAAACGRDADSLKPEMDLRYDLALRSSRFPLIVQEVEEELGISVDFEALLHVATVGDLLRVLA
ncbi:acyltransferase domain-containing protein, partial [Desulfovibrio sp.]